MVQPTGAGNPSGSGLAPNVASLLCYVCGFITGIVFLIIDKDNREVRYHAWQSIFLGVAVLLLTIGISILSAIFGLISSILGGIVGMLSPLVGLGYVILWIVCMIKAYNGERFKIPVIGDLAEKQAARS